MAAGARPFHSAPGPSDAAVFRMQSKTELYRMSLAGATEGLVFCTCRRVLATSMGKVHTSMNQPPNAAATSRPIGSSSGSMAPFLRACYVTGRLFRLTAPWFLRSSRPPSHCEWTWLSWGGHSRSIQQMVMIFSYTTGAAVLNRNNKYIFVNVMLHGFIIHVSRMMIQIRWLRILDVRINTICTCIYTYILESGEHQASTKGCCSDCYKCGVKKVQFVIYFYHIENSVIIYILIFQRVCVCTTKKLEHP